MQELNGFYFAMQYIRWDELRRCSAVFVEGTAYTGHDMQWTHTVMVCIKTRLFRPSL